MLLCATNIVARPPQSETIYSYTVSWPSFSWSHDNHSVQTHKN